MTNKRIRDEIKSNGLRHWQLADALGISEASLVRKLRHEIPEEETDRILEIIGRMRGGAQNE